MFLRPIITLSYTVPLTIMEATGVEYSSRVKQEPKRRVAPSVRWLRADPDTSADFSATLGLVRSSLPIMAGSYYMDQMRVRAKITITDPGATVNVNHWFVNGSNFIQKISIKSTAGGDDLTDNLDDCSMWTRAVNPLLLRNEDFLRMDSNLGSNPAASVADSGSLCFPARVTPAAPAANTAATQYKPIGSRVDATGAAYEVNDEINEPASVAQGADTTVSNISIDIPMKMLVPLTAAALPRLFSTPAEHRMEIMWNSYDKVGFISTSVTAFTGNDALVGYDVADLHVMVPSEANDQLRESIEAKVRSVGLKYLVPRLQHIREDTSGTAFNVSYKCTSGFGHSLLAIFSAVQSSSTADIANYNISNLTASTKAIGAKITSFQTRLDGKTLQDSNLVCADLDDYNQIKEQIADSAISSGRVFNYNRCFFNSFVSDKTCEWKDSFYNFRDGKDLLPRDLTYQISAVTPSLSQYCHLWVVTQATLEVSSNGKLTYF